MTVLLQYNITTDLAPSTTATGITGATLTNASLTTFARDTPGYATDGVVLAIPPTGATSAALAITNNSYFFFSITPTAGKVMSLTSMTFNIARGGASTPRGYDVRSNADSYAASLGTADVNTQRVTFTGVTIDLSGASFQSQTGAISFRVYIYCPTNANSLDLDDLIINGTVADTGTLEQEGFRFRADDGSESGATWLAVQDTNVIRQKNMNTRVRVILNSTLDRASETYQLEFRKVGDTTWNVIS